VLVLVLFRGRQIVVANVGDSAAVLCRNRKALEMSIAHTPGRKDEQARIEAANGWVRGHQDGTL
jgi:serine/threonine protein phosphatase PrpC